MSEDVKTKVWVLSVGKPWNEIRVYWTLALADDASAEYLKVGAKVEILEREIQGSQHPEVLVVQDAEGCHLKCPFCGEVDQIKEWTEMTDIRGVVISDDGKWLFVDDSEHIGAEGGWGRLACHACMKELDYPSGVDVDYVSDPYETAANWGVS